MACLDRLDSSQRFRDPQSCHVASVRLGGTAPIMKRHRRNRQQRDNRPRWRTRCHDRVVNCHARLMPIRADLCASVVEYFLPAGRVPARGWWQRIVPNRFGDKSARYSLRAFSAGESPTTFARIGGWRPSDSSTPPTCTSTARCAAWRRPGRPGRPHPHRHPRRLHQPDRSRAADPRRLRPDRRRPVRWRVARLAHRPVLRPETARLTRAGIRVFCIRGNHDAASVVTARHRAARWGAHAAHRSAGLDPPRRAERRIHGMGFSARSVPENVVPRYPPPLAGHLNIGMLHTSATDHGTHETYAPCTVPQLVAHGYDYWALGHVHTRQELARNPCWIVFPGNTQGRHIREAGPERRNARHRARRPDRRRGASRSRRGPLGAVAGRSHRLRQPKMTPLPRCAPDWTRRSTPPATACLPRASCCLARQRHIRRWCATSAQRATSCTLEAAGCAGAGNDLAGKRPGAHPPRARLARDARALRRRRDCWCANWTTPATADFAARSAVLLRHFAQPRPPVARRTRRRPSRRCRPLSGHDPPDLLESARNLLLARLAEG